MQRTKSSSQAGNISRPISITTNFKFEKVQKLNSIVQEISEKEAGGFYQDQQSHKMLTQPRQIKSGMSEMVLDLIKNRIKTNYDQLYTNYGENKNKILRQIQAVETNITGQNAMNSKFDCVIKEKAKYDKVKAQMEQKQSKLRKLIDMRNQIKNHTNNEEQGVCYEVAQKWASLDQKRQEIYHQSAILQNTLAQRKVIRLSLKERYERMTEQINVKKQRIKKMEESNLNKMGFLAKIEQDLSAQAQIQIPLKLAQQLSNKLEQYQNKHSYSNIIQHEATIEQKRLTKERLQLQSEREVNRKSTLKREAEEKCLLEECHSLYQIRQYEQQKLKKLCGVEDISQITNGELTNDKESLEHLLKQIQEQTSLAELQSKILQNQLQDLMKIESQGSAKNSVYQLQKLLQNQQKQLSRLNGLCARKSQKLNDWLTIAQLMKSSPGQPLQQIVQLSNRWGQAGQETQEANPKNDRKFTKVSQSTLAMNEE